MKLTNINPCPLIIYLFCSPSVSMKTSSWQMPVWRKAIIRNRLFQLLWINIWIFAWFTNREGCPSNQASSHNLFKSVEKRSNPLLTSYVQLSKTTMNPCWSDSTRYWIIDQFLHINFKIRFSDKIFIILN